MFTGYQTGNNYIFEGHEDRVKNWKDKIRASSTVHLATNILQVTILFTVSNNQYVMKFLCQASGSIIIK